MDRMYLEAKRPSALFSKIDSAIVANLIELPNGRRLIPKSIEKSDFNLYNFRFNKGTVIRNVSIANVDLPDERFFPLLLGRGVVRMNKLPGGDVDEEFIPSFKDKNMLKAKLDRQRSVSKELEFSSRNPEGTPRSDYRHLKEAEHAGDFRKKMRSGSRRYRSRAGSLGLGSSKFGRGLREDEEEFVRY